MRSAGTVAALIVLLSGAAIHAQEDAGAADSEGDADAGVVATAVVPPPTPTPAVLPAPAVVQSRTLPPSGVSGYSAVKDARYRGAIAGGVLLEVGGAASLVSAFMVGVLSAFSGIGCGGEDEECKEESTKEGERQRTTALVLAPVGLVLVAVGIPAIICGYRGHKRQNYLKSREDLGDRSPRPGLSVAIHFNRDAGGGGLMLSGSF
jgi:hypothetical protein